MTNSVRLELFALGALLSLTHCSSDASPAEAPSLPAAAPAASSVDAPGPSTPPSPAPAPAAAVSGGTAAPSPMNAPPPAAMSGDPAPATPAAEPAPAPPASAGFPAASELGANGPFTAVTTNNSGPNGGYTLYAPAELGKDGVTHPFVTWGNGATTVPSMFPLLPRLATHGFVVIASNNAFVTGPELIAGIDWLFMENERAGGPFYQKLDTSKVAALGYSLGSLGTFEIAADPRLKTTVHISGGAMDKAVLANLRNPVAYLCGDDSDIANANCDTDFEMTTVPVFYGIFPGDHFGILGAFEPQLSEATTGWLRWRLLGEQKYESLFAGPGCGLCDDDRWTVQRKLLDVAAP